MKKNPAPKKAPGMPESAKGTSTKANAPKRARQTMVKPENVPLTARQEAFAREYLIDLSGTQAAIRAGYSPRTARQMGTENLTKPSVQAAIAAGQRARALRTEITSDRVLKEIWSIAIADPRELVQIKVGCCRSCWGEGHKWQRTVAEMSHDSEAFVSKGGSLADFDKKGGTGFDRLKPPHPLCPSCGGDGTSRIVLADTQNLSPAAAALYAGAKTGKYGVEIAMHSKVTALEMVAKHLGLYREDNTQKVDALQSLLMGIAGGNASGFRPVAIDPEHAEPSPSAPDADDED
jgi:phage terminase small subunit